MALEYKVLGQPGRDNALWVRVNTGQSISRLLFDCGDGCLSDLPVSEIQATDHLFFSHLHMDHIAGFDAFFRCTFNRSTKSNVVWGPPETAAVMHHRFLGFWWNLHDGQPGTWRVNDILPDRVEHSRYEISEAFAHRHADGATENQGTVIDDPDFSIQAIRLEHHGPCLGYLVQEAPKWNVQVDRLAGLGLHPGPWMQSLKGGAAPTMVEIEGKPFELARLREDLLVETPGESIAYLTDFLLDENTCARLEEWLGGCSTVICEAQYRDSDAELAQRNCHTTTKGIAQMAARAGIGKLILFHLSGRYTPEDWADMLEECREVFPATMFPEGWNLEPV